MHEMKTLQRRASDSAISNNFNTQDIPGNDVLRQNSKKRDSHEIPEIAPSSTRGHGQFNDLVRAQGLAAREERVAAREAQVATREAQLNNQRHISQISAQDRGTGRIPERTVDNSASNTEGRQLTDRELDRLESGTLGENRTRTWAEWHNTTGNTIASYVGAAGSIASVGLVYYTLHPDKIPH